MQTIGQGGMAAVYQARDTRKGTLCAIKEMSLSTVAPDERAQAIQNFLAEAKILSRLNHPNLPAFTDFFTEDARHYLVMEYIDGSTLEELLDRNGRPFSERRVLGWARQLCDVLEYLHSQQPPVIFRDMKPGNVMLTRTGRIKLIDFGIARLFKGKGSQDTQLLGTPGFAPPEQYGSAQTDERSDIYSLAMTLFQLMTCSISEKGFGLSDVHSKYPHISPPVARALEKATAMNPEDRYESIVVFRRALLGIDTFRFENGGEATTPEELAELAARYPEEASNYLLSGEIESWLSEIGANDLARSAKRIRATVGDPEMGVTRLIQAVMGPNAGIRLAGTTGNNSNPGTQTSRSGTTISRGILGRSRESDSAVIVRPRTIDFGQVYPGLSAPLLLTITGAKGALVSGTIQSVESWIITDVNSFDGMNTPVRVRVDSTRLRGSTHYRGTIIIHPEDSEREIPVQVQLDVLGYSGGQTQSSTLPGRAAASRGPGTQANQPALDDEDEDDLATASSASGVGQTMAGQTQKAQIQQYTNTRIDAYKEKYGAPGSGGWNMLNTSARQLNRMKTATTFAASFMLGAFSYLVLAHLPAMVKTPPLPPSPWFLAVLLGMLLFSTLGALLINLSRSLTFRDILNRAMTGLVTALPILGLGEFIWQTLGLSAPPLQLFVLLLLTAAGTTLGTSPRLSNRIIRTGTWLMTRLPWVMYAGAVIIGGGLGAAATSGISFGCFTPFGALGGAVIGVMLVLRIRRLITQGQASPAKKQTP